jgi:hypothetical protein
MHAHAQMRARAPDPARARAHARARTHTHSRPRLRRTHPPALTHLPAPRCNPPVGGLITAAPRAAGKSRAPSGIRVRRPLARAGHARFRPPSPHARLNQSARRARCDALASRRRPGTRARRWRRSAGAAPRPPTSAATSSGSDPLPPYRTLSPLHQHPTPAVSAVKPHAPPGGGLYPPARARSRAARLPPPGHTGAQCPPPSPMQCPPPPSFFNQFRSGVLEATGAMGGASAAAPTTMPGRAAS